MTTQPLSGSISRAPPSTSRKTSTPSSSSRKTSQTDSSRSPSASPSDSRTKNPSTSTLPPFNLQQQNITITPRTSNTKHCIDPQHPRADCLNGF
ncbi:hypothetical protein H4Q26_012185 [Puccinia striiformis f. sp. tritici PST-130]|nr:hypothetical protein H4Q26_012185 [Puccinia striiformis f. sp. tritici PST-130]